MHTAPLNCRGLKVSCCSRSALLGVDDVAPVEVAAAQALHKHLRRGGVGGKGDLVLVAQALAARKNRRLMSAIRAAELVLPGDRGIFIASRILGMPLHYKMSAPDFASALLARLSGCGKSVFLVGARQQTVQ